MKAQVNVIINGTTVAVDPSQPLSSNLYWTLERIDDTIRLLRKRRAQIVKLNLHIGATRYGQP